MFKLALGLGLNGVEPAENLRHLRTRAHFRLATFRSGLRHAQPLPLAPARAIVDGDAASLKPCEMTQDNPKSVEDNRESPVFDAVITPHRSLSPRGLFWLMVFLLFVTTAMSVPFYLLGAWPVLGFLGLDILLIYLAFRYHNATARGYEQVVVSRIELLLRSSAGGASCAKSASIRPGRASNATSIPNSAPRRWRSCRAASASKSPPPWAARSAANLPMPFRKLWPRQSEAEFQRNRVVSHAARA